MAQSTCPPVLFLVFNRPDTTARAFEAIRAARPARLYVAADGPRGNRPGEAEVTARVRDIATRVDWPCTITTLFRDENLGCRRAVSSAITWFFEHEPEGVILEDDCLAKPDFFTYCAQLLERYRFDERIGFISGTALGDLRSLQVTWGNEDYVYTRYPSVWGWASWRRVWSQYDVSIEAWDRRRVDVEMLTHHPRLRRINASLFDRVRNGEIDTWDYQVSFLLWSTGRLAIAPRMNLIENVGFGPGATHTTRANDQMAARARGGSDSLQWPLQAPELLLPNRRYQDYIEAVAGRSRFQRLLQRIGLHG